MLGIAPSHLAEVEGETAGNNLYENDLIQKNQKKKTTTQKHNFLLSRKGKKERPYSVATLLPFLFLLALGTATDA